MNKKKKILLLGAVFVLLIGLAYGAWWNFNSRSGNGNQTKTLQTAWVNLTQQGSYKFATTVEQITYPAPTISNAGRSSTREIYYIDGETDLNAELLSLKIWPQGSALLNQQESIEIKIENGEALGRYEDSEWIKVDKFDSNGFAPGQDAASYIRTAKNVRSQKVEPFMLPDENGQVSEVDLTHYVFDVDSMKFADMMRDQLILEYQRKGKLPIGMTLDLSEQYQAMIATGEVWVNANNIPVRMRIEMEMPPLEGGEHIKAIISTDFYPEPMDTLQAGLPYQILTLFGTTTINHLKQNVPVFGFLLLSILLVYCLVRFFSQRVQMAFMAVIVILSMLISPVWQGVKAAEFSEAVNSNLADSQEKLETQKFNESVTAAYADTWDIHQDPMAAVVDVSEQVLNIGKTVQAFSTFLSPLKQPALDSLPDETLDSDGDGLTDVYEDEFENFILNKNSKDTDGDGLDDGVEVKLALLPGSQDSDNDGILDPDEVLAIDGGDKKWYSNPTNNDTDSDGMLDGTECPQRVRINTDTPFESNSCHDTDGDGTPDIFDIDDDNDGVPTIVDTSPYQINQPVFTYESPFKFSAKFMESENTPVLVDLQVRPTNSDHLTYLMNVLDWPKGDTDGQIMRVIESTYGDRLTSAQLLLDPKAANGDMRLTPMLEFRMEVIKTPFPLTDEMAIKFDGQDLLANFTAKAAGNEQVVITLDENLEKTINLYRADGNCGEYFNRSLIKDYSYKDDSVIVDYSLASVAKGDHVFIAENMDGTEIGCVQPFAAFGYRPDRVIDTTTLAQYGAFVRNDTNGDILVYAPLTLEYDQSGSSPVAFRTRVPYFNNENIFINLEQEVRMVWMLNMLTDVCKPKPDDEADTSDEEWCSKYKISNWITDLSRNVFTYTDDFTVTGMTITEDHGVDMDVILRNPDSTAEWGADDPMWGLAYGLQATFLAGDEDLTLDEIYNRFDADEQPYSDGDDCYWNIPKNSFQVEQFHYDSEDGQSRFIANGLPYLLNILYGDSPAAQTLTLLYARNFYQRSLALDSDNVSYNADDDGVFHFSFNEIPEVTQSVLNWAPYRWQGSDWEPYTLEEYLDQFEVDLRASDYFKTPTNEENRDVIDGKVQVARITYETYYHGMAALTKVGETVLINNDALLNDGELSEEFEDNESYADFVGSVVESSGEKLTNLIKANPSLRKSLGDAITEVKNTFKMFKNGLANKNLVATIKLNMTMKKIAFGLGKGTFAVGMAACTILSLPALEGVVGDLGGKIIGTTLGLVSSAMAFKEYATAVTEYFSPKSIANASNKAGIIGAAIAVAITWGAFIATWADSGLSAGSLQVNNMAADAIAATLTIILLAALAATGIGAVLVAAIAVIDGIIAGLCEALGAEELEEDHWVREYLCAGISGLITKMFKWFFYSQNYIIDYEDEDRMQFVGLETTLKDETKGLVAGNQMNVSVSIKDTITLAEVPIDYKAQIYGYQFSDENVMTTAFKYVVQTEETDIHEDYELATGDGGWVTEGENKWTQEFSGSSTDYPFTLPAAGINRGLTAYVSEAAAIPTQECWAIAGVPYCSVRTYNATIHTPLDSSLVFDIFPPTLDEFYTLIQIGDYGYALAWGRDAVLSFPTLKDADGDSLISKAFPGGNDPDDSSYDTDRDGLSDAFEMSYGINPRIIDTDQDGLDDLEEIQKGTDPLRADSDGDGLPDAEELAGWLFVYSFEDDGTPLETMVYSNPLVPDSDFDGITDLLEKTYGFNPNAASELNILNYDLNTRELDSPLVMLRFEEENGAILFSDSSNFNFDGFCETDTCPVAGLSGQYGNAVRFDGNQAVTLTTTAAAINLENTTPFTFAGWINRSVDEDGTILSKWMDDPAEKNNFILAVTSDGKLQLTGPTTTVTSTGNIPVGTWTHYAVTFDDSTINFYLNGTNAGSADWANAATSAVDVPIMIGAYAGTNVLVDGFKGYLDEISIFDRALSELEIKERQFTARYNFNDSFVRPGEEISYQSLVKNLLNNRFAYGLLTTEVDKPEAIVDAVNKFLPKTFTLNPDNPVESDVSEDTLTETIQISNDAESTDLTIKQQVSAQIVDQRTESNFAKLWLKLNEADGSTSYEDSSGNMPSRIAECSAGFCPVNGQDGVYNQSVKFESEQNQIIALGNLETLNLVNSGYTISLWVKPDVTSTLPISLISCDGNEFVIKLENSTSGYAPVVYHNGLQQNTNSWRDITTGTWNNLVVVYSSDTQFLDIYINGAKVSSIDEIPPISANAYLTLGGTTDVSYWVDDLRIFSRPLSVLDINKLAEYPILQLSMDDTNFTDTSINKQIVSFPKNKPGLTNDAIRGTAMFPGSGSTQGNVFVNGNDMLDLSDGVFTISTWIYPENSTSKTWQGVFGYRDLGSNIQAYPTLERLGNKLRFGFGTGGTYEGYETALDVLTPNEWNHVVITFEPADGNNLGKYEFTLYINGELKESKYFDHKPYGGRNFYVGHSSKVYKLEPWELWMEKNTTDPGSEVEVYVFSSPPLVRYPTTGYVDMSEDDDLLKFYEHPELTKSANNYETLLFTVMEDDDTSSDDTCGIITKFWFDDQVDFGMVECTDGFKGQFSYKFNRPSIQFFGRIDEFEMYRYAIDAEQVRDLYQSIPINANLPLDDRPGSERFENRSEIGSQDDGECNDLACPAAGTIGLINQAVQFDGNDDVIDVPVSTTSDYMISLWLNTDCADCGVYTLKSGDDVLNELFTKNGNICAKTGDSQICSNGAALLNGQWHNIVYGNNNGAEQLWFDGEKVNEGIGSLINTESEATAQLGMAVSAQNDYLSGQLDDVRIYRYSQPDEVVKQLNQMAPLFLSHLDDMDAGDGINDDTPADWVLTCTADTCPKIGVPGRLGNGMEFDAQNDMLSLTQTELSTDLEEFTISIWVKPGETFTSPQTLWAVRNKDNTALKYSLALVQNSLDICVLSGSDSAPCVKDSNVSLIANNWNLVTFVVERQSSTQETYQLYINGYLDSSGNGNGTGFVTDGMGSLTIGNDPSGTKPFGGVLDEVSIFSYALDEIDIRDTFHYQMEHVEETDSLTLTIDADKPLLDFVSYNPDFPYLAETDLLMHLEATDPTSGVALVEMTTKKGESGIHKTTAPLCLSPNSGTSFCPTIEPFDGEGEYSLNFRLVDQVGNVSLINQVENESEDGQPYILYVDGSGPSITVSLQNGQVVSAQKHQTKDNTWYLHLSGSIIDGTLADGNLGSGLPSDPLTIVIENEAGEVIGDGMVKPNLSPDSSGYNWEVDYLFRENEPTGLLSLRVLGKDRVENETIRTVSILLDATAPVTMLDETGLPIPVLPADLNFEPFSLTKDEGSNGILKAVLLQGSADDTPNENLPYMTADGREAVNHVNEVGTAYDPAIRASFQYNEPYPENLLAWLPLDKEEVAFNQDGVPDPTLPQRYFLDISPYQISGVCEGNLCPVVSVTSHKSGAMKFNGNHQMINLGQNVDLSERSFTISLWVKRDSLDKTDPLLWQGPLSLPEQRFLFGFNASNQLVCGFGGSDLVTSGGSVDTDWHYLACTYDQETGARSLWSDGQLIVTDQANPIPVMYENLYLGQAPVGSFSGSLDELIILDDALNESEIRAQYTAYQAIFDLDIKDDFIVAGDQLKDRSGYFHKVNLLSKTVDPVNKSFVGIVGNYALGFDGDDHLAVEPSFSLALDRATFTEAAWVYPTAITGEVGVISQFSENPERRYPSIILMPDQSIKVGFGTGYEWLDTQTESGILPLNDWSYIAASFDGTNYRIYLNGQMVLNSTDLSGKTPYPSKEFNNGEKLIGLLDEVMIYARALQPFEIKANYFNGWQSAVLNNSGNQVNWQAQVPFGLEGPYNLNVRAGDEKGHILTDPGLTNQWGGTVDSYPPRLMVNRQQPDPDDPNLIIYDFEVYDTMLNASSIHQNLCEGITLEKEYFNSSWYLAGGVAPNSALYRIRGTCFADARTTEETGIVACDLAGNCSAQTYTAVITEIPEKVYLPLLMGGSGQGTTILPTQNPNLERILEKAQTWPTLADSIQLVTDQPTPQVWIEDTTITYQDVRSVVHINIHGAVNHPESIEQLTVNIWHQDELIVTNQAAVIGNVWNVFWPFNPGEPPEDGTYQLEMILTDKAGEKTTVWETITVRLKP